MVFWNLYIFLMCDVIDIFYDDGEGIDFAEECSFEQVVADNDALILESRRLRGLVNDYFSASQDNHRALGHVVEFAKFESLEFSSSCFPEALICYVRRLVSKVD